MARRLSLAWLVSVSAALGAGCAGASQDARWQIGRASPPGWNRAAPRAAEPVAPVAPEPVAPPVAEPTAPEPYSPELAQPRTDVGVHDTAGYDEPGTAQAPAEATNSVTASWEGPAALFTTLFQQLANTEAHTPGARFAVLQLGDSHTESDVFTSRIRRRLQSRLGDAGRGYIAPAGGARDVRRELRGPWAIERVRFQNAQGAYGLGLARARAEDPRAVFRVGARAASRYEVHLRRGGSYGGFEYQLDGGAWTRAALPAVTAEGVGTFEILVAEGTHEFAVRPAGDGPLMVYGIVSERAAPGVVLDSVGWIGAQATHVRNQDWTVIGAQLAQRAPSLVVLAFGTNESVSARRDPAVFEQSLVDMITRVREAAPSAMVLVLGPPDVGVRAQDGTFRVAPRLLEIVAAARHAAESNGAFFVDLLRAMGGPGTMESWTTQRPQLAGADHVHLTTRGYTQLADAVVDDLLRRYDAWRAAAPPSPPAR